MSEPFYNSDGQVLDKQNAEELAYLEKLGRDNALEKEAELARKHQLREEAKVGETSIGKKKAEFIDYLSGKYPDVFEKITDDKERDALIYITNRGSHELPKPLLITRYGMVQFNNLGIGLPGSTDQIGMMKENLGKITDVLKEGGGNMTNYFGSDGIVLGKIMPLIGGSSWGKDTLNFSNESLGILNVDIQDDQKVNAIADKIFGKP